MRSAFCRDLLEPDAPFSLLRLCFFFVEETNGKANQPYLKDFQLDADGIFVEKTLPFQYEIRFQIMTHTRTGLKAHPRSRG
jgi:hypothetical protein